MIPSSSEEDDMEEKGVIKTRRTGGCWIVSLAMVLFSVSAALALPDGKITAFTADQVHLDPSGKIVNTGKLYVTPEKMTMDGMPAGPEGQTLSIILFKNEKRQCTLNNQKKLYFEGPVDNQKLMQDMNVKKTDTIEKIIGTETISGFKCTKKEMESTVEFMGIKRKSKQTVWVTDMLDMPVRTQTEDGSATELRNIEKGMPAAKYFEIPKDYKKVSNMMAVMGMEFSEDEGDDAEVEQEDAHPLDRSFDLPKELKNFKLPSGNPK
jgi:hypothetical protein